MIILKIGNVVLDGKVVCAPMAGITNRGYRKIAKEYGASLVCTEMISDKALCFNSENTYKMIEIDEQEHPVSLQLFGSDADIMSEMAKRIEEFRKGEVVKAFFLSFGNSSDIMGR